MADTQQQQDSHRNPEKNNATTGRTTGVNNGTSSANNTASTRRFSLDGIQVNPRYFSTLPGILKIVEWVLAIICIACAAPALISAVHWFLTVVVICFILTFVWMCIHFFTVTSVIPKFQWGFLELIYAAIATVLYFIAMVVMLQQVDYNKLKLVFIYGQSRWDSYITAGCFSLFNTLVYAVETAYHFKEWMDSRHQ